jgi:hypothetical protein
VHLQVRFVVVDFTDDDLDGGLSRISQRTADIHVGILINNVGISYPYARFFHELDEKLTKNLLRVNIEVTTRMIQLFLPSMLKHKRGAIINIGSGAGSVLPSDPLYTLYAATKAFVDQLSRSLYVEYKHSGIDVQCQVLFSLLFFSVLLYLILFFLQYQVPNIAYLGCNGSSFSFFVMVGFFLPNLPGFLENSFESLNPE